MTREPPPPHEALPASPLPGPAAKPPSMSHPPRESQSFSLFPVALDLHPPTGQVGRPGRPGHVTQAGGARETCACCSAVLGGNRVNRRRVRGTQWFWCCREAWDSEQTPQDEARSSWLCLARWPGFPFFPQKQQEEAQMARHTPGPTAGAQGAPGMLSRPCKRDGEDGREDGAAWPPRPHLKNCSVVACGSLSWGSQRCHRRSEMLASRLCDRRLWPLRVEGWAPGKSQGGAHAGGGCPASMGFGAAKGGGPRSQETRLRSCAGWWRSRAPCQGCCQAPRSEAQAGAGTQDGSPGPAGLRRGARHPTWRPASKGSGAECHVPPPRAAVSELGHLSSRASAEAASGHPLCT